MEDKRCYTPLQKGLPPIENRIYTTRYEYSTPLDIILHILPISRLSYRHTNTIQITSSTVRTCQTILNLPQTRFIPIRTLWTWYLIRIDTTSRTVIPLPANATAFRLIQTSRTTPPPTWTQRFHTLRAITTERTYLLTSSFFRPTVWFRNCIFWYCIITTTN